MPSIKTLLFVSLAVLAVAAIDPAFAGNRSLGDSYTLWGVIFNAPENCSDGVCNEDDVFVNPGPPETAVIYLGGLRVPPNGAAALGASLGVGETFGALPFPAQTIHDTELAEVHLVLRTHGGYMPGLADDQITTFGEGCQTRECEDIQFAVFKPGEANADGVQHTSVLRFSDLSAVPFAWATLFREPDGIRAAIHTSLREEAATCGH